MSKKGSPTCQKWQFTRLHFGQIWGRQKEKDKYKIKKIWTDNFNKNNMDGQV